MHLNYPTQLLKRSINQQRHCHIHGGGLMFGKANDLSPQYIDILTEHYDLIQLIVYYQKQALIASSMTSSSSFDAIPITIF